MNKTVIGNLAGTIDAYHRCVEKGNAEWEVKHLATINEIAEMLPSGSGIDCGTKIDLGGSTGERVVLIVDYHHMDESGGYDGWTKHTITVTASLIFGFTIKIGGRDRNGIKEYLSDVYNAALGDHCVILTDAD